MATKYTETLDYLFRQLPMFHRIGAAAFKKDLTNTLALCHLLGQPQTHFPTIHIAGTNGKGSVAHMLSAIFTAAGYRTGLYTSPHYRDFRERVKIDGQPIPKKQVVAFVEQYQAQFEAIQPSFFEWTVALAFHYFSVEKVDVAIIETGLGGRLDSTNVIQPMLSVITNISLDHQQFLGETLPEIAGEKAGIIKHGVPVIIGETHPETKAVFDKKARESHSHIVFADQHFEANQAFANESHCFYEVKKDGVIIWENLSLDHLAAYQKKNLATVLCSLSTLAAHAPGFLPIGKNAIETGLENLRQLSGFLGRWEFIGQSPRVLCDSAHNEDGIRQAMEGLRGLEFGHLHFVFGMVSDKTPDLVLRLLPKDAIYYFVKANIPRGLNANELREAAARFGLKGRAYSSVRMALAAAKKSADKNDLIFVGGSIFVVAEVI